MKFIKPVFLIVLFYCLKSTSFILAQDVPIIENPNSDPVQYCEDPVAVVASISIQNIQVDEEAEGMKISISPYIAGEDRLEWDEVGTFSYHWNEGSGYLEISGIGTDTEYQEAVSKVYYKNVSNSKSPGIRSFSITLRDADYLPATGRFYRFVSRESITWTDAQALAASMDYYGLQGYLATIRSKVEQDFIYTKTEGTGWIGGSDADQEGTWKWVEGPDDGVVFWSGADIGSSVDGEYSNWRFDEPNNLNNEDYAHILYITGSHGYWNDLPNSGTTSPGYIPQGFLIEFGGMPDDPEVKLSAVAYVEVKDSEHPQLDGDKVKMLFCGGTTHTFEIAFTNGNPSVVLEALDAGVSIEDETTYNPIISVSEYGTYSFLLTITDESTCQYIDTLQIGIHNQPEATFNLDEDECYGYNLQLAYTGSTVETAEFTWYYNSEEFLSGEGMDSVTIPLGFESIDRTVGLQVNEQGCVNASLPREVLVKPDIILSTENTEGCSPVQVEFIAATSNPAVSYLWDFADGNTSSDEHPTHQFVNQVDFLRSFDISLTVVDENNCENTELFDSMVVVYPVPVSDFNFAPVEILITDPEVSFSNMSHGASSYFWDFGDGTSSNFTHPQHRYDDMNIYPVSLLATNEFGCRDSILKPITVTFDRLFPPNAFSPNATLEEDREFRLYGEGIVDEGYQLLIFNRWGEIIFESNSPNFGWDGKMKNNDFAPAGVYTWVLQYSDFTGEQHKQQGVVTLLL